MTNLCGLWSNLVYYTLMKTTTTKPVKSTCVFQVKENLKVEVRTKLFWDDPHWVAMAKMSWVFHRFLWGQEVLTFTVVHSTHIDLERQSFKTECFTKKKIKKINKGSFWQHILLLFFFFSWSLCFTNCFKAVSMFRRINVMVQNVRHKMSLFANRYLSVFHIHNRELFP